MDVILNYLFNYILYNIYYICIVLILAFYKKYLFRIIYYRNYYYLYKVYYLFNFIK